MLCMTYPALHYTFFLYTERKIRINCGVFERKWRPFSTLPKSCVLFAVRIISYYCTDRSNKKLVTKCGARQHFKQRAYVSEFI